MAASMLSTATVAAINRAAGTAVAPYTGLKSNSTLPVTGRRIGADFASLPTNGGRVSNNDIQVWPPEGRKKFETLSYLQPLSRPELAREVDYLIRKGWIPCLEFDKVGFVSRDNNRSPGYYDGRYWTMWKLPMYGCTDSSQVLKEVDECISVYPNYYVRIIGFDNRRQVQCISFIAYKPPGADA